MNENNPNNNLNEVESSIPSILMLAPERFTVEQKKRNWENELKQFREKQRIKLKYILV